MAGIMGNPDASPLRAVGDWFIEITPGWLAELAISWFGTADKLVLGIGMLAVLAVAGAAIGVLAVRNRPAGLIAAGLLLATAAVIVWSRRDAETSHLLPIAAAAVSLPTLTWLARRGERAAAEPSETAEPSVPTTTTADDSVWPGREPVRMMPTAASTVGTARRTFLRSAGGLAALAVAAGGIGRWLGRERSGVEASRDELTVDLDLPAADVPPEADLDVSGAQPWRTPNDDFYLIDTAFSKPHVHPDDWTLRIHGMVEREVELTFDELVEMGLVDAWVTLACVSNPVGGDLIGNALWTGVPVADVLALARPLPDADAVKSTSHDGWTCGTPLDALTDGRDALFAVGMNGEPLPVDHGFPVRMVVPGLYGYVSATKWVVELEVTRFDRFQAYWTTRGWSERGPIKVSSRIDVPDSSATVAAGQVTVAGTAWAQHRGVEAVEVRVDDGDWTLADLGHVPTDDTWRQWVFSWDATPGEHTLQVRATTADGEIQTGDEAPPAPDGATGFHTITVTAE
ncbi:molybdopterin-dependent oxidoreductase [Phytoactinopolyspora halotolerans]|uniref:Molybdopterin-dependent oxidoreductase n=2 Tax=Phytoactinopolyspora halotolerans TaxID=1981512 RepID=A0A6L9S964_9ACTN|nr:molybdopterin-dependent oxidoreductase [Phytoactinopolyspora halotolerans]